MAMTQNEAIDNFNKIVVKQREDIQQNERFIIEHEAKFIEIDETLNSDKLLKIGGKLAAGEGAGENQEIGSVAIGPNAGNSGQKQYAVAIGDNAGALNQSQNAIAIGAGAGQNNQPTNSIVIGTQVNTDEEGDILLETSGTTNSNDNKFEIKHGQASVNGIPLVSSQWTTITDLWPDFSKYKDREMRVTIGTHEINVSNYNIIGNGKNELSGFSTSISNSGYILSIFVSEDNINKATSFDSTGTKGELDVLKVEVK